MPDGGAEGGRTPDLVNAIEAIVSAHLLEYPHYIAVYMSNIRVLLFPIPPPFTLLANNRQTLENPIPARGWRDHGEGFCQRGGTEPGLRSWGDNDGTQTHRYRADTVSSARPLAARLDAETNAQRVDDTKQR